MKASAETQQPADGRNDSAKAQLAKTADASGKASNDIPNRPVAGAIPVDATPQQILQTLSGDDYRIGAGDVLQISVWKEPEVSVPSTVVRPDGKITMPLLKDIVVAGLTPGEVEKNITKGLAGYITGVNVTVVVAGMNSKKIYVIGAVKKEGPILYTYRMTIMQALSEAGGLTDYAKRKKIYVLRAENGKETRIQFDYDAVLKGDYVDSIALKPSDTLVIPH